MPKSGFRIMDSDMHVMEPHDLWLQHLPARYRERAPQLTPMDAFLAVPGLDDEARRKILWDNCARLYGLG